MHLVVAIGALHCTLDVAHCSSGEPKTFPGTAEDGGDRKTHYIFALQRYGQALGLLSNIRKREYESESRLRHALIVSLLTTCFETCIGNRENAITQAKAGIDLLFTWTAKHQKDSVYEDDDMSDEWTTIRHVASTVPYLEGDLLSAFQRLDHQIILCRGFQPGRRLPQAFPNIYRPFKTLEEACKFWDLVIQRVMHIHSLGKRSLSYILLAPHVQG